MAADGEKGCALVHQKSSKPRPRLGLERERQWLCFDLGEVGDGSASDGGRFGGRVGGKGGSGRRGLCRRREGRRLRRAGSVLAGLGGGKINERRQLDYLRKIRTCSLP